MGFNPRIFVATPTHICKRYCALEFCEAVKTHILDKYPGSKFYVASNSKAPAAAYYWSTLPGTKYRDMNFGPEYYGQVDSIHRRITETVSFLRDEFLSEFGTWDYYLSLESDVIVDADTLPDMLRHGVSVLHSNCYQGFNTSTQFARTTRLTMGCTLIHRNVVKLIPFRYDKEILKAHYDALFAHDCVAGGAEMYYDPMITPQHRHDAHGSRGWNSLPVEERGA